MKTQKTKFNLRNTIIVLVAILMVLVATVAIIEVPKAATKEETAVVDTTRFEEVDNFSVEKMVIVPCGDGNNEYYVSLRGSHVVFLAKVGLEEYICYNQGDIIPGKLIVEGEKMDFELDEFGKSFKVLGYVGLAN